ncbi:hypothetical protein D3C84_865050 [compost metagenome]
MYFLSNLQGVDISAGLKRALGRESLYLKLLKIFLVSQEQTLERLFAATIGFNAVAAAAGDLEALLYVSASEEELRVAHTRLIDVLGPTLSQLSDTLPHDIEAETCSLERQV